ncbi:oncostatin-M isoform X2 [Equus asinus]|uniref:Oncostatin M n=1 Tax=Equus asinus TaxID=9793 RepID=A0A9L0JXX2_EQUAS|nr:oncostatin-M [Equus asinus]XP_046495600.1 oncostatin-M isoform X2 [Equus quagga]
MRAQLTQRMLLSLVLGLLFLSTAAMGSCSANYQGLLQQLQSQADLLQDTSLLLDPYIRLQGLDTSELRKLCKERPGAFPSQDALWELSRWDLLRTLNATLGQALHRLTALQQDFPKARDWLTVTMNIRGFQNNIHCLSQLLRASSETAKPTQASPGASPPPIPASDAFQHKLEGCQFLSGFHRLMGSAGQVFREWGKTPRRSRRHSPRHLALRKGPRGVQLFRRGRRLVPRGQLPR